MERKNKTLNDEKSLLRNIVSLLTPRNYPNMRELFLLFIFPSLMAKKNIVTTHARDEGEGEEIYQDRVTRVGTGGKFINCRSYAWHFDADNLFPFEMRLRTLRR